MEEVRKKPNALVVGDKVIITTRYSQTLDTVCKLTPTQIVMENTGYRFRKKDGRMVGEDMYTSTRIAYATEEDIIFLQLKAKRKKLIRELTEYPWHLVKLDVLESVTKQLKGVK